MHDAPPSPPSRWRQSSYSGGGGGGRLEAAYGLPGTVPVRDSKNPAGPALRFHRLPGPRSPSRSSPLPLPSVDARGCPSPRAGSSVAGLPGRHWRRRA